MATRILCDPDDKKGRPIYGKRITASFTIEEDGKNPEILKGTYELCDAHAKPFHSAIEFIRQMILAGRVEDAPAPPAEPEAPRTRGPKPGDTPATPPPQAAPEAWKCLAPGCGQIVDSKQRNWHGRRHGNDKAWKNPYEPLFDVSGWEFCSCGWPCRGGAGLKFHQNASGHTGVSDDDLSTSTGAALNRAVEGRR